MRTGIDLSPFEKEDLFYRVDDLYNQLNGSQNNRRRYVTQLRRGLLSEFQTSHFEKTAYPEDELTIEALKELPAIFNRDYKLLIAKGCEIADFIVDSIEKQHAGEWGRKPQSLKIDFGFSDPIVDQPQVIKVPIELVKAEVFIRDFAAPGVQNLFGRVVRIVQRTHDNQILLAQDKLPIDPYAKPNFSIARDNRLKCARYDEANSQIEHDVVMLLVAATDLNCKNSSDTHATRQMIGKSIKGLTAALNYLHIGSREQGI